MVTIKEHCSIVGKAIRKENRLNEKFSKKYPHYTYWGNSLFNEVKGELISIIGHV